MKKAVLPALTIVFLALTFSARVEGDGSGYFAYLHSIVVDHDLNLTNEYVAAHAQGNYVPGETSIVPATGLPANQFPIGPAILSLPFYLAALATAPSGNPQFGPPFTLAFTLASLLYGALALALIYIWLRRLSYSSAAALIAIAGVSLATPFLFYAVYEPSYSHMFSSFAVTVFMFTWWSTRESRGLRGWLLLGLLGGLMALVRWQDGLLMVVTVLDVPRARARILALVPGALVVFMPQFVVDEVIFGRLTPGATNQTFSALPGHYVDVLFSSLHGLFTWSPILLAALAGYWFVRDGRLRAAFAICFAITLAITGAFVFWYAGAAFGMRFFINLTPFFAIGLAALAARLRPAIAWTAVGVLVTWNLVLILSFSHVMSPDHSPGYAGLLADQLRALAYTPHLVQGYVARSLVAGRNTTWALTLLAGEALVVLAALAVARRGSRAAPDPHAGPGSGGQVGI